MNTTDQNDPKSPVATLVAALINDPEYAWGWYCNIAMACYDKGARPHSACNAGAALFLKLLTDGKVDITSHPAYQQTQYNASQDPAPAGKLTDEELGNMAAIASGACDLICKPRATAFARAVREAVEKENKKALEQLPHYDLQLRKERMYHKDTKEKLGNCLQELSELRAKQAEEITSLLRDKADAIAMAQAAERETSREQDMRSKDREEIARLTADLEKTERSHLNYLNSNQSLRVELDQMATSRNAHSLEAEKANAELERYTKEYGALIVEHSKLQADLERLRQSLAALPDRWRKDKERAQSIRTVNGCAYELEKALKPAPTAEEVERERFEKVCANLGTSFVRHSDNSYGDSRTKVLFDVWNLARAAKEGEK